MRQEVTRENKGRLYTHARETRHGTWQGAIVIIRYPEGEKIPIPKQGRLAVATRAIPIMVILYPLFSLRLSYFVPEHDPVCCPGTRHPGTRTTRVRTPAKMGYPAMGTGNRPEKVRVSICNAYLTWYSANPHHMSQFVGRVYAIDPDA